MRFMMLIKANAKSEAGVLPGEKLLTEMGKFNDELIRSGALLAGDGLKESSHGARIRMNGAKITVLDGPFSEAKELIAGYWIIRVGSKAEAIEWAKRVPGDPDAAQGEEGEIELRQLFELEDFPVDASEQPDGWRDQEQSFREATDTQAAGAAPLRKPGTKRFIVFIKADRNTEAAVMPTPEALAAMGALLNETVQNGSLLGGEGLKPTSDGAKVRISATKRTVIDGPFTEAKELVAGYSVIQVPNLADAIEFGKRMLRCHVEHTDIDHGAVEVRQLFELEDVLADAPEKSAEWKGREAALSAQLS